MTLITMLFLSFFLGATTTVPTAFNQGYNKGYEKGYLQSLQDANKALKERGIEAVFSWQDLGSGAYKISLISEGKLYAVGRAEIHLWIEHYRDGQLISSEFGAGVLTNGGKDWIEQQISGSVNATQKALYLSDSNDATDPPLATWTQLPTEITTNGLDRQLGTYTSTGVGTWNVTKTKSVTGTQSTQLWGLQWKAYSDAPNNNLLAADSGPTQKNTVNGDTLKETWQVTVS